MEIFDFMKTTVLRIKNDLFLFGLVTICLVILFNNYTLIIIIIHIIDLIVFLLLEIIKTKRNQSIANNAPSIDFRMRMYYKPFSKPFAVLETRSECVSEFNLIIDNNKKIGYSGKFERITSSDESLEASFSLNNENEITEIIKSIETNNGYLLAEVSLNNGTKYQYKYKTKTNNWKLALQARDNMSDTFILFNKSILK